MGPLGTAFPHPNCSATGVNGILHLILRNKRTLGNAKKNVARKMSTFKDGRRKSADDRFGNERHRGDVGEIYQMTDTQF